MTTKLPEFYHQHRTLKRIRHQSGPWCYAAAICGAMEAESKEYLNLDDDRFNLEMVAADSGGRAPNLIRALEWAKDVGVWCKSNKKYIKIKHFYIVSAPKSTTHPDIISEIKKGKFPIASMDLGDQVLFNDRFEDGVAKPPVALQHATVCCDVFADLWIVFANSWGIFWKQKGYAMMKINDGRSRKTFDKAYSIVID